MLTLKLTIGIEAFMLESIVRIFATFNSVFGIF